MFREANNFERGKDAAIAVAGPMRMCVGCRERSPQGSLVRIFFSGHPDVEHDRKDQSHIIGEAGTLAEEGNTACDGLWRFLSSEHSEFLSDSSEIRGRSAYTHFHAACIEKSCIQKRLQRAFRQRISQEDVEVLKEELLFRLANASKEESACPSDKENE